MEDLLKCQISPLFNYRQNQTQEFINYFISINIELQFTFCVHHHDTNDSAHAHVLHFYTQSCDQNHGNLYTASTTKMYLLCQYSMHL